MAQTVEDIAAAIVAALSDAGNAADFPEDLTAAGRVRWEYVNQKDYQDYTTDPEVVIFPKQETTEPEDRLNGRFTMAVGIAVIRQVNAHDKATLEPLLALPRAIRDFLFGIDQAECNWQNTTLEVLYGYDELKHDATLVSTIHSEYWIDQ